MRSSDIYRTIRCEVVVQEQLELLGNLPRIDDALAGLSEAFHQHPEKYPIIDDTGMRIARFVFYDGAPPVRLLFEVTQSEILVVAIQYDPEQSAEL